MLSTWGRRYARSKAVLDRDVRQANIVVGALDDNVASWKL